MRLGLSKPTGLEGLRSVFLDLKDCEAITSGDVETWNALEISEDYIRHGVSLILDNVSQYVKDARLLVSGGSVAHATVLALYASEELGKANLLLQTMENKKPAVDSRLFRGQNAHRLKMEEARRLLGDSVILQSSVVGRARIPFHIGAPDVEASPNLRMDCTYVDFRDEQWVFGAPFPVEHLANLLNRLEEEGSRLKVGISLGP